MIASPRTTIVSSYVSASPVAEALRMARQTKESIRQNRQSMLALRAETRLAIKEARAIRDEMREILLYRHYDSDDCSSSKHLTCGDDPSATINSLRSSLPTLQKNILATSAA
jgi:hypothetical protein